MIVPSPTVGSCGNGATTPICVRGNTDDWTSPASFDVWVKVYLSHLSTIPSSYPEAISGTKATVSGTNWDARCVSVPALDSSGGSLPGCKLTVVAFQVDLASSTVVNISFTYCYGIDPSVTGGIDTCAADCGSGSGSGALPPSYQIAVEMEATDLRITMHYTATLTDPVKKKLAKKATTRRKTRGKPVELAWTFEVGKQKYTITRNPADGRLIALKGRGKTGEQREATAVSTNPFSAAFPGEFFGTTGEVVVTLL
jgi:hypothetical protein